MSPCSGRCCCWPAIDWRSGRVVRRPRRRRAARTCRGDRRAARRPLPSSPRPGHPLGRRVAPPPRRPGGTRPPRGQGPGFRQTRQRSPVVHQPPGAHDGRDSGAGAILDGRSGRRRNVVAARPPDALPADSTELLHRRHGDDGRPVPAVSRRQPADRQRARRPGGVSPAAPQVSVTWYEAAAYCNWLSRSEGLPADECCYLPNADGGWAAGMRLADDYLDRRGYRLPTEAEWEFACRAGSAEAFSFGADPSFLEHYAAYAKNAAGRPSPVGTRKPNDFGLFDMHGNVAEWCQDRHQPDSAGASEERVIRGGAFDPAEWLVSAARTGWTSAHADSHRTRHPVRGQGNPRHGPPEGKEVSDRSRRTDGPARPAPDVAHETAGWQTRSPAGLPFKSRRFGGSFGFRLQQRLALFVIPPARPADRSVSDHSSGSPSQNPPARPADCSARPRAARPLPNPAGSPGGLFGFRHSSGSPFKIPPACPADCPVSTQQRLALKIPPARPADRSASDYSRCGGGVPGY